MWVFAAGMQRSGSTVQYQIAKELIKLARSGCDFGWIAPENHYTLNKQYDYENGLCLLKSHRVTDFIKDQMEFYNAVAIYSHRCILDVISSLKEKNKLNYTKDRLQAIVLEIKRSHDQWMQWDNIVSQSYEDLIGNLEGCVNEIAIALNINVTKNESKKIADVLDINNQRRLIESLRHADGLVRVDENNIYDPESLLHLNHISDGGIGRYKKNLTHSEIEIIKSVWPEGICSC